MQTKRQVENAGMQLAIKKNAEFLFVISWNFWKDKLWLKLIQYLEMWKMDQRRVEPNKDHAKIKRKYICH